MELLRLRLKNFRQYRNAEVDFGGGLTGIVGKNGAGKSTIFEAVNLALFGTNALRDAKEQIRSIDADVKEPVEVELSLRIDGEELRVLRQYRGKNLTNESQLFNASGDSLAVMENEVNSAVSERVGMTHDDFRMSVYAKQKDLAAMSSLTAEPRLKLMRRMVGLDTIDTMVSLMRKDLNRFQSELRGKRSMLLTEEVKEQKHQEIEQLAKEETAHAAALEEADRVYAGFQKEYEALKKQFDASQDLYKSFNEYETQLKVIEEKLSNTRDNYREESTRKKRLEINAQRAAVLKESLQAFREIQNEEEELARREKIEIQRNQLRDEIARMDQELRESTAYLDSLREDLENGSEIVAENEFIRKTISELQRDGDTAREEISRLLSRKGELEGLLRDREDSYALLRNNGPESACPTCRRPLTGVYDETLQRILDELTSYRDGELQEVIASLESLERKLKGAEENLDTARKKKEKSDEHLATLSGIQKDLKKRETEHTLKEKSRSETVAKLESLGTEDYDEKRHKELKEEVSRLKPLHDEYLEKSPAVKELPDAESRLQKLEDDGKKLALQKEEIVAAQKGLSFDMEAYMALRNNLTAMEEKRDAALQTVTDAKTALTEIRHERASVSLLLKEDETKGKNIVDLEKELKELERLTALTTEFKHVALERVRPRVAHHASRLFAELTQGRYPQMEVNENFEFFIMDQGQFFPLKRFSGGEVDLANLCIRVALSRTVTEMTGRGSAGFMAFDEIFGSQDSSRRQEIMRAFHQLQEQYRQIFIISHIEDVKDEFPRVIEVTTGVEGSQLRVVEM